GLEEKQKPKVGDRIRVTFNVNSMRKIRCEAVVVRHCEARGRYPEGLGLRFIDFDKVHHKTFQKLIRNTPKELLL
ncbi:MAG: PilZ domain-containing protein, partial [Bdellovibrionales bacterium]|nr:PilZ domain-containing protein [Bdellovibrionales bacterium]